MSKSLGNAVFLSDDETEVAHKVMRMFTDPTRIHPTDPGHVDGNPVFVYHDAFNPDKAEVEDLKRRYRRGAVGDVEVKQRLARALNAFLEPIRERRREYGARPEIVDDLLADGCRRGRAEASRTLRMMREHMQMDYFRDAAGADMG
jgi:tryptophanyl-tRNA synthetase